MPQYVYRSKGPQVNHVTCACRSPGYKVVQVLSAASLTNCPGCRAPVYRAIQKPLWNIRHVLKGDMRDYREDLARFPRDPEAFIEGPRSLGKLMDKRKRQGWQMGRDLSAVQEDATDLPTNSDPEQMKFDAYEEARAEGFDLNSPDVQDLLGGLNNE